MPGCWPQPSAVLDSGPAAEWLLDNYHVVQEHLQEVRASLPGAYYRELPELSSGPLTGYPRVYEMAISLISHTEARIDLAQCRYLRGGVPGASRCSRSESSGPCPPCCGSGLIESVRRMTLRTVQRLDESDLAVAWADRLRSGRANSEGSDLRAALREFADAGPALTPHFVSRFLQTVRQAEGASASLEWLEHWMREVGVSPEDAVAQAHESPGAHADHDGQQHHEPAGHRTA